MLVGAACVPAQVRARDGLREPLDGDVAHTDGRSGGRRRPGLRRECRLTPTAASSSSAIKATVPGARPRPGYSRGAGRFAPPAIAAWPRCGRRAGGGREAP
jgi:hypothetical protein